LKGSKSETWRAVAQVLGCRVRDINRFGGYYRRQSDGFDGPKWTVHEERWWHTLKPERLERYEIGEVDFNGRKYKVLRDETKGESSCLT